jgi:hypothetical protein
MSHIGEVKILYILGRCLWEACQLCTDKQSGLNMVVSGYIFYVKQFKIKYSRQ